MGARLVGSRPFPSLLIYFHGQKQISEALEMAFKQILIGFAAVGFIAAMTGFFDSGQAAADDRCPVVLTVYGEISESNRGAIDDFDDVLLYHLNADFDQAYTFCRDDLDALPQTTITANYQNFTDGPVTATGPTLAALMETVGISASFTDIVLTAVDGYEYPVEASTDLTQVIAATHANGAILDLGGRGPVWIFAEPGLINDSSGETDAGLVWALIAIRVE